MRRFAAADGAFAERFVATENKHLDAGIDCQIDCQSDEKAAEGKGADINYQDLRSAESAEGIAVENEVDTNQKYPYCYN